MQVCPVQCRTKLTSFNWSKIVSAAINIYTFLVCFKYFTFLILQCRYVTLQDKYSQKRFELYYFEQQENINNENLIHLLMLEQQIRFLQKLMSTLGVYARETEILAITIYSACGISLIFFFMIGTVFFKQWRTAQLLSCNFVLYLVEPQLESQRIEKRIEECLERIIESNSNYASLRFSEFKQDNKNDMKADISVQLSRTGVLKNTSNLAFRLYSIHQDQQERVIRQDLENQLNYLNYLTRNKTLMWPPNRTQQWKMEMKQLYVILHTILLYSFWFQTVFSAMYIPHAEIIAVRSLRQQLIHPDNRTLSYNIKNVGVEDMSEKFNPIERFIIAEEFFYVMFILDWFVEPLTLLLIILKDHYKHLTQILYKLDQLEEKLERFQQFKTETKKKQQEKSFPVLIPYLYENDAIYEIKSNSTNKLALMSEELEQKMRQDCDNEAIKVYIDFNLFCLDSKSSLKLSRRIIEQRVTYVIVAMLPTLAFIETMKKHYLATYIGVISLLFLGIDGAFCICAFMHSSSMKVYKRAWSIMANSNTSHPPSTCWFSEHMLPCGPKVTSNSSTINYRHSFKFGSHLFRSKHDQTNPGYDKDEQDASCSLTPHTLILWQRLLENHELFSSNFLVKIFDMIRLDFNGIVRINFWVISVFLLSFIYRH